MTRQNLKHWTNAGQRNERMLERLECQSLAALRRLLIFGPFRRSCRWLNHVINHQLLMPKLDNGQVLLLELYEPFFRLNVFQITDIDQRFIFQSLCTRICCFLVPDTLKSWELKGLIAQKQKWEILKVFIGKNKTGSYDNVTFASIYNCEKLNEKSFYELVDAIHCWLEVDLYLLKRLKPGWN